MRKLTLEQRIARLEKMLKNESRKTRLSPEIERAAEKWFNANVGTSELDDYDLQRLIDGDDRNTFALGSCIAALADQFPELYDYSNQRALLRFLGSLAARAQ